MNLGIQQLIMRKLAMIDEIMSFKARKGSAEANYAKIMMHEEMKC